MDLASTALLYRRSKNQPKIGENESEVGDESINGPSIPTNVVDQFDVAITIMDKCLKAAGAGAEHVVKVQVMTDITERPKIDPRRIAYFGDNLPVSTLVEVKGLVDTRMKVRSSAKPT